MPPSTGGEAAQGPTVRPFVTRGRHHCDLQDRLEPKDREHEPPTSRPSRSGSDGPVGSGIGGALLRAGEAPPSAAQALELNEPYQFIRASFAEAAELPEKKTEGGAAAQPSLRRALRQR